MERSTSTAIKKLTNIFRPPVWRKQGSRSAAASSTVKKSEYQSFLDNGTSFEGTIRLTGLVRLDGEFRGEVDADGLVIGESGSVHARLSVRWLVVHGSVTGEIAAKERVEVGPPGSIEGSVSTPKLTVHEGARINGKVEMGESARHSGARVPGVARLLCSLITWFALCAVLSYSAFQGGTSPERSSPRIAEAPAGVRVASAAALPDVAAPSPPREPTPPSPTLDVITGSVPQGGTLSGALIANGVSTQLVYELASTIQPLFDFRGAQPRDFYSLIQGGTGQLLSFEYHRGRRTIYRVEPAEGGLVASKNEAPLERRMVQLGGMIDRSLSESLLRLGERSDLVQGFADLFVWDVDFSTETRPGHEFRLVFEKFYDREGFVRYGRILAAAYQASAREFVALLFEDGKGRAGYFTPEGNSLRRTFLRAPVSYTRISSHYSKSRLHPILKVRRPHEGVDYAAPVGTPVWAVADGEVIFMGSNGGFGRLIKVRHNNGYVSYYGHLSRYAKSLKTRQRVHQKQVIGFVGSTGLATGPHLDYRLRIGGRFVDPLKVKFPKGGPISEHERVRFDEVKEQRLAELRQASPSLVFEAAM